MKKNKPAPYRYNEMHDGKLMQKLKSKKKRRNNADQKRRELLNRRMDEND